MVQAMPRMIAFGEPRLDADLATILGASGPPESAAAGRGLRHRLVIEAVLAIAAALVLAQLLPGPAGKAPPKPRKPVAMGPISTPPGGILPKIRTGNANAERAAAARAAADRSSRAKDAARATPPSPRPARDVAGSVRELPERKAASAPVRRAGPRRTVGFPAAASDGPRKTLIAGGNARPRIGKHGPRHHRRPGR